MTHTEILSSRYIIISTLFCTHRNNLQKANNYFHGLRFTEKFLIFRTERQRKIIIVRDPYDAIYSWTKYLNGFYGSDEEITDDNLVQTLKIRSKSDAASSFQCISTWWPHRNDSNVLFLFYEDLICDLEAKIKEIASFIIIPLTEDELRRITYLSLFKYMSKNKEKFKGSLVIKIIAAGMGVEPWLPKIGMVRASGGKVGQGQNLGPKLKALVDQFWKETMADIHGVHSYDKMR